MKTIISPTDFSTNAYSALRYATQLFVKEECQFIIIHSFESQVTNLTSRVDIGKTEAVVNEFYDTYEAQCEKIMQEITLETANSNHTYKVIATSLSLSRAINMLAEKEAADYVVMGNKGKTQAENILMGSNTLAMIQKIKKVSLLIIPEDLVFKSIKKIAFATGFKRPFQELELQPLLTIATQNEAEINIVHVNKKEKMTVLQRSHFQQLFNLLKTGNPENTWLLDEGDTFAAIRSYLDKAQIDMLTMVLYKHNFFDRLFREATVKNIAKYASIPFLILPKID